jgi:hypothetical protein
MAISQCRRDSLLQRSYHRLVGIPYLHVACGLEYPQARPYVQILASVTHCIVSFALDVDATPFHIQSGLADKMKMMTFKSIIIQQVKHWRIKTFFALGYKSVQTIANGVPSNDQFSRSDNF